LHNLASSSSSSSGGGGAALLNRCVENDVWRHSDSDKDIQTDRQTDIDTGLAKGSSMDKP